MIAQRYDEQSAQALVRGAEYPARRTVLKWARRMRQHGHTRSYTKQGNLRAAVIRGETLLRLAAFKHAYPRSSINETNAFLWNSSMEPPGQRRLYSASQISNAEDRLGLSLKVSSTTARQAMLPINIQKRHNFWHLPYPFGVSNINREDLIDMDEAAVFLETINRKRGKTAIGTRCREVGVYGHSTKYTLMMAISADPNDRIRHHTIEQRAGTGNIEMAAFIRNLLTIVGPGTPARRRCFIMDNLTSHHSAYVRQIIVNAGHRLVFRAPYYPVDGPIEFVFNTIEQRLNDYQYTVTTGGQLVQAVNTIVTGMHDFENYFIHCGY